MLTSLLRVFVALLPFIIIISIIYRFVGKKAGKITGLVVGLVFLVALPFALFGGQSDKSSNRTLHITEWQLSLALTPDISDAYYTLDDGEVYISTRQLDRLVERIDGCTSGLHGLYYKRGEHAPKLEHGQARAEPACVVRPDADTSKIDALQESIQAAAQTATAEGGR